jgi:hypothetical protein
LPEKDRKACCYAASCGIILTLIWRLFAPLSSPEISGIISVKHPFLKLLRFRLFDRNRPGILNYFRKTPVPKITAIPPI